MNKSELLKELSNQIKKDTISKSEVLALFKDTQKYNISVIAYILGGSIIGLGVIFFIAQIWSDLNSILKILVTFGLGILFTISASLLLSKKIQPIISFIFHIIGAILLVTGSYVFLFEIGFTDFETWFQPVIFGYLTIFYSSLAYYYKHPLLQILSIFFGTGFMYGFIDMVFIQIPNYTFTYLTFITGLTYQLIAYAQSKRWHHTLIHTLQILGCFLMLYAGFNLAIEIESFWILLYILLILSGYFYAIYLKRRSILIISTGALIFYSIYLTNEYFSNSLSWPIILILMGILISTFGYISVKLNKEYLSTK